MKPTGERFIPGQQGSIELEHLNRYYFAVNQIDLAGKTVLDIASGEGYGSNILSQYAHQVIGVDLSTEAITFAKSKYQVKNLKFVQGNATDIPLENHSVDVVVSFETIEHHDKHNEMMLEIKRVLKIDGVLVISSPDKFYYSDVPNFKNEFHIKELYYEEFKDLIGGFFKKTIFYSQKVFLGSIIALDENTQTYKKPIVINSEGNPLEFTPVYNIAICTDSEDFSPKNQMILYKNDDNIITTADIQTAIQLTTDSIQNSKAYRIGKLIIKPLSFIRRTLKIK